MSLSSNLRLIVGAVALLLVATTGHVVLAQETADLNVTASIVAECTLSGNTLDLGNYDAADSNGAEGSANISYQCTNGTNITVGLGGGGQQQGAGGRRAMLRQGGGGTLLYDLYTDTGYGTVWGTGSDAVPINGTSAAEETVQVFGLIDPDQPELAGSYTDVVQITLNIIAP